MVKSTCLVVVALACGAAPLGASEVADTRRSAFATIHPVRLDEVRWTPGFSGGGFWADRVEVLRTRSLPAMWAIMKGTKYKPFYQHFLIAAGDIEGDYHGAPWNDGDFYKFLEAACAVYAVSQDPELGPILDQSIDAIGRAQRSDGYIHTPVLIRARNGDRDVKPFQDRNNFEMYNMGHLMTTACIHHRVTGRDDFLRIAKKAAEFLCDTFREPTPELARNSVCPSHYMGVIELYRTTGQPRYLELAKKLIDVRNLVVDGTDDNQDRIPFSEQREAVGHAVRANYLYAGAADLYLETGDPKLKEPLDAIWQNVTTRKMYITGGCGALYDGASPDGSEDQQHITRVHQAYGRNYQLPNVTAHNETCAAVGNVLWNWRMFLATGEARYVDVVETALYNAVLAGVSLDGKDYFYVNPLRQVEPLPTKLRWSRERVPFVTSHCCPPNVLRTIAEVNGYAYGKTDEAIWINLYGANQLSTAWQGQPLKITQSTDYPWDGRVRIHINECADEELTLRMRIPGWAKSPTLRTSWSEETRKAVPNTYTEIRRRWKPGDALELQLNLAPKLMESHPLVEETSNQVAVKCGPIVYCLESPELPEGVQIQDIAIAKAPNLQGVFDAALLGGVVVIEADALVKSSPKWKDELYRSIEPVSEKRIRVRFIPYYAWANRGPSEMSVWLPMR